MMRWKVLLIFVSLMLITGAAIGALSVTYVIPAMIKNIMDKATLTIISSTPVKATIDPVSVTIATEGRLDIDTPIVVVTKQANVTLFFKGELVAKGTQPLLTINPHSSATIMIDDFDTSEARALTLVHLVTAILAGPVFLQVVSSPIAIILGLEYQTNLNKTVQLPPIPLSSLLVVNNMQMSKTNTSVVLSCVSTSVIPLPWEYILTQFSFHVSYQNQSLGMVSYPILEILITATGTTPSTMDIVLPNLSIVKGIHDKIFLTVNGSFIYRNNAVGDYAFEVLVPWYQENVEAGWMLD